MKKLMWSFLFGFLALNLNIFSMEHKQNVVKQNPKTTVSALDWAKVIAASAGIAWFGTAALGTYSALKSERLAEINLPLRYMIFPTFGVVVRLLKLDRTSKIPINELILSTGITSGIIAAGLGLYVYKKLSSLRPHQTNSKKISE